ncbi:MAG TPA: discoidin domain-containing protein [Verrucomicrobiae bacterium]|nr:discoidin domain-containing protein [Verrucomicrobiae bacterium]
MATGWNIRASAADATNVPPPGIAYLSAQDEAKTFVCEDGYKMELVLSDPIIEDPVITVFDGNGRMFVAEMRSYMRDADGSNERARTSRISVHWSSKHNGVYDKHAIYVDHLLLPRMILPLADGILVNETDTDDIWYYTDTKHNGVSDKKELWYAGGPRGGNIEHQPSGLIWDLDNWIYMAVNSYRLRMIDGKVVREPTGANGGQWGLSQDDYGKLWNMNAGYEAGPVNFQVPMVYGSFYFQEASEPSYAEVFPIIGIPDFQGGLMRVRPGQNSLNHFTATSGSEIYRGDRLPADLRGDLLFGEPVGRLIRRTRIETKEGFTRVRNYYNHSEMIRSTDPNFRPVNVANAPDGSIFVADMYRGIIQEKDWVNPGSYLRGVVDQWNLARNFGRGRIWRISHKDFKPGPQPRMLDEPSSKLVTYLAHPSGWWRDTAQKLLVLRGDKSVAPDLIKMARTNPDPFGRIHSLWTLEGIGALEPELIREKLKDKDPEVRIAAIRTSETLYKKGDHSLVKDICTLTNDSDPLVVMQVMMTASLLKWPDWDYLINETTARGTAEGVKKIGARLLPSPPPPKGSPAPSPAVVHALPPPPAKYTASEKLVLERGELIYKQLCFTCHGPDGRGTPLAGAKPGTTMAPPLSGDKTANGYLDGVISVVLKGLNGPVEGKNYDAVMVPMESNDDTWVASVISYIRNNFGNHSTFITSNDVARVRAAIKDHTNTWTLDELRDSLPQPLTNRFQWKLTASHNPNALRFAIDGNIFSRWDSLARQTPGMWVQVELPEETELAGVELDSGRSEYEYPRAYKIQLSKDGKTWSEPVASGNATALRNTITFPPMTAKFVRITQTGSDPAFSWAIHELQLLQSADSRMNLVNNLLPPSNIESIIPVSAGPPPTPTNKSPYE